MEKVAYDEMFDYFEAEINVGIKGLSTCSILKIIIIPSGIIAMVFDYMPQWGF